MRHTILTVTCLAILLGCTKKAKDSEDPELRGNTNATIIEKHRGMYVDPVDDTINYKRLAAFAYDQTIYAGPDGKAYVIKTGSKGRGKIPEELKGESIAFEYFDVEPEIDISSYKTISRDYFSSKGKVYFWFHGDYRYHPVEVQGADPSTFVPFQKWWIGGRDRNNTFINTETFGGFKISNGIDINTYKQLSYGVCKDTNNVYYVLGDKNNYSILEGADPNSAIALMTNHIDCYVVDKNAVYYDGKKIVGADPKTFDTIHEESKNLDARDKNKSYYKGKAIN